MAYCRHCEREDLCKKRGLCKRCYNNPRIRKRYPVPAKYVEYTTVPNLPDEPTQAQPGSEEKMQILERRMRAGTQLFHPMDNVCFVATCSESEH